MGRRSWKVRLFVHVKQLEGLPVEGEVLLKLTVLPLGKVIKTARAEPPRVNEHLHLTVTEPARKVLRLSVYPARSQGKYGAIGHALLGLEEVLARKSEDFSMKLYRNAEPDINPGSIQLSLEYDMKHQRLTLRVKKASNLMIRHLLKSHKHTEFVSVVVLANVLELNDLACKLQAENMDILKAMHLVEATLAGLQEKHNKNKFNTYVKAALFKEDQKLRSKKSSVVGNERDPCYDQEFLFKIPQKHLADSSVVVSIMLKELLRKDIAIGRVILGPYMYAEGHTLTPWGQVMEKSQCVEHWFRLYL
uniref:C2 domain-containing protein n=1 Tax=Timema cristinae TaxID=61476 RepID=A0A7R9D1R8_TIMCR|nr:unnamed protein product [Timema cristinae]